MAERKSDLGARSAATGPDIRPREATWLPALNILHPLKNFEQFVYVFFLYRDHIALQVGIFLTNKIT
ncbi:hypothetical protein ALC56_07555 [Trachymyrmex septentrionalis]|uniref:Uncharacterized protein n=1 Tax=Trachymyrmex septentrionalis TaxID=34720 RepID=A0A151JVN4_9HYME|nr:hypothetical protein ALC56_07555 [Trachymyrmex septentrionalis]